MSSQIKAVFEFFGTSHFFRCYIVDLKLRALHFCSANKKGKGIREAENGDLSFFYFAEFLFEIRACHFVVPFLPASKRQGQVEL